MITALRAAQCHDGFRFRGPATVLLDGPRVLAVLQGHPATGAEQVYDFPTGTVLPGLVDTHVHLCGDGRLRAMERAAATDPAALDAVITASLAEHLAAGVTTVRDLGDSRFAVVDRRDRQARDQTGVPTILAAGPSVTIPDGHAAYLGGGVSGPEGIRAAVRERVERGVDVVKVMGSGGLTTWASDVMGSQFTDPDLMLIVSSAHAAGLPVTVHSHSLGSLRQAVAAGVDGVEHCSAMTDRGMDLPEDVLAAMVAQDVAVGGCLAHSSADVLTMAPPSVLAVLRRAGVSPQDFDEQRTRLMRRLVAAGVSLSVGTDGGVTSGRPHGGAAADAATVLRVGGTASDAVAAATSVGARVCRVADRKGRLAPGLDADVLVADGDVAADITALQRPLAVVKAGRMVPPRNPGTTPGDTVAPPLVR